MGPIFGNSQRPGGYFENDDDGGVLYIVGVTCQTYAYSNICLEQIYLL